MSEAKPISDIRASAEYRRDVIGALARRLVKDAYDAAKGGLKMSQVITFNINDQDYEVIVSPTDLLVDVIRKKVGLTGTKRTCTETVVSCHILLMENQNPIMY